MQILVILKFMLIPVAFSVLTISAYAGTGYMQF